MEVILKKISSFFKNIYKKIKNNKKEELSILSLQDFYLNSSDLYSTFIFAKNNYNYSFYNSNLYKAINENLENIIQDNKLINNQIGLAKILEPFYNLFSLSLLKNFNYLVSISSYIAFLVSNKGSYNYTDVLSKVENLMKENNDNILSEYKKSSNLPIFSEANTFILNNIKTILPTLNPINLDPNYYDKVFELYFKAKTLSFVLSNLNYLTKDMYLNLDSFINECFELIKPLKDSFKKFYDNNKQILDVNFYTVFVDLLSSYFNVSYKTNGKEVSKLISFIYNLNLAKTVNPDLLNNSIITPNQDNILKNIVNNIDFDKKELKKNIATNLSTLYINSVSSYLVNSIKSGQNNNGDSLDYLYLFLLTSVMISYLNNNQIDTNFKAMLSNLRNFFINKPAFQSIFDITFSGDKNQITALLDMLNKISLRVFLSTFNNMPKSSEFYFKLNLLTKISTKLNKSNPNYQKYISIIKSKILDLFKLCPDSEYLYQKTFSNIFNNSVYPTDSFLKSLDSILIGIIPRFANTYDPKFLLTQTLFLSFLQNLESLNSNNVLDKLKYKYLNIFINNVVSDKNLNFILKDYSELLQVFPENLIKDALTDIIYNYYVSSLNFIKIQN
jgi:hypothetical protein